MLPFNILSNRADIILLQVPLAYSICLSGTRFIHLWKQEGFRTSGRSLRMTIYKGIAKHSSSQSHALMFITLGGVIYGHGHIVNKDGRGLLADAAYQISRLWSK